jgi:hypothetical protein
MEDLVPVRVEPRSVEAILRGEDKTDYAAVLQSAFGRITAGRDIVVLEGGCNLRESLLVDCRHQRSPACWRPACWR